jgi:uncharacterized protein (TIRG00374 family)
MAVTGATRVAHPGRAAALRMGLGLAVGALLVLGFMRLVNVGAVLQRLGRLAVVPALLCGVVFLSAYVVRALRWRLLMAPHRPSVGRVVAIYQVATFLNWLLPVRGGELAKCLLLRHSEGVPMSRSLATVSIDKAMDMLPALALVALLPFVNLHLSQTLWLLLLPALAVVVVAVGVISLAAWRRDRATALLLGPLQAALPRSLAARVTPFLSRFLDALSVVARRRRVLAGACAYTALAVALDASFCLLAFRAVGVSVSVPVALYGYTLFNLAFILPTPPGQVGSNELMGLLIFSGVFGLGRPGVGAMFLFSHPWTALLMSASGMLCLSAMGLSLRGTLRLARSAEGWQEA